jgi:hypothetical protein
MSIAEAFDILRDRRGTMYDPRVVDTLIALQPQLGVTGPDVEAARPDPRSTAATPVRSIPAQR